MNTITLMSRLCLLVAAVMLSACGSAPKESMADESMAAPEKVSQGVLEAIWAQSETDEADQVTVTEVLVELEPVDGYAENAPSDPDSILSQQALHFDFDKSAIKRRYLRTLAAHAQYLHQYPEHSVVLEGHTDERGTREYNIALGERRAAAVRKVLLSRGARSRQLTVISYGEERPAIRGTDETSYALNRRVEIIYR